MSFPGDWPTPANDRPEAIGPFDPLDPRGWPAEPEEPRPCFIRHGEHAAQVDADLWPILARYAWNSFFTRSGKRYFRRAVHDPTRKSVYGKPTKVTLLLHREVLILSGRPEPFPRCVGDHRDGNELDCRIRNLRWTTYLGNTINRVDRNGNRPILEAAE